MNNLHEVFCPKCGSTEKVVVENENKVVMAECKACGRNFFCYKTQYGVVVSTQKDRMFAD